LDANVGIAVAGEHKRKAAVADGSGHGRGDAALDLECAAYLAFKVVNRPNLDNANVPIRGAQGFDKARLEQAIRSVANPVTAFARVERRDDNLNRKHRFSGPEGDIDRDELERRKWLRGSTGEQIESTGEQ